MQDFAPAFFYIEDQTTCLQERPVPLEEVILTVCKIELVAGSSF